MDQFLRDAWFNVVTGSFDVDTASKEMKSVKMTLERAMIERLELEHLQVRRVLIFSVQESNFDDAEKIRICRKAYNGLKNFSCYMFSWPQCDALQNDHMLLQEKRLELKVRLESLGDTEDPDASSYASEEEEEEEDDQSVNDAEAETQGAAATH
jgi:hypothetical protein